LQTTTKNTQVDALRRQISTRQWRVKTPAPYAPEPASWRTPASIAAQEKENDMKTKKQTVNEAEQAYFFFQLDLHARKVNLAAAVARELGDPYYFGTVKLKEVLKERFPKLRFNNDILVAACDRCRREK
jgi:hypothetical protein